MGKAIVRTISDQAAEEIGRLAAKIGDIMGQEADNLQRVHESDDDIVFAGLPEDLRMKLMTLSCCVNDYNLWIRRVEGATDEWFHCTEIETGATVHGASPAECCERYFGADSIQFLVTGT